MKKLKVKSILFSLLTIMAVSVFLTSCEQEEIIGGDDIGFLVAENDSEVYDLADLSTNAEGAPAATNAEDELESRSCPKKVRWLSCNRVSWTSNPQYALWIRHFDSGGAQIGTTQRMDVPYCGTWTKYYNVPPNRYKTEAFVGYKYWGTRTAYCW